MDFFDYITTLNDFTTSGNGKDNQDCSSYHGLADNDEVGNSTVSLD